MIVITRSLKKFSTFRLKYFMCINKFFSQAYRVVSSAQFAISDSATNKKRSHKYISNNKGPKTDSCIATIRRTCQMLTDELIMCIIFFI